MRVSTGATTLRLELASLGSKTFPGLNDGFTPASEHRLQQHQQQHSTASTIGIKLGLL